MFNWTWRQFNFCVSFYFACLLYLLVTIIDYRYFTFMLVNTRESPIGWGAKPIRGLFISTFSSVSVFLFHFPVLLLSFLSLYFLPPSFPSFFLQIQLRGPKSAVSFPAGSGVHGARPRKHSGYIMKSGNVLASMNFGTFAHIYRVLTGALYSGVNFGRKLGFHGEICSVW